MASRKTGLLACALVSLIGTRPAAPDDDKGFGDEQARAFLTQHCVECHSGAKPKGDLRLDPQALSFSSRSDVDRWQSIQERVGSGAMPPKAKARPPKTEIQSLSDWIAKRITAAELARREAQGRVVYRRLNRIEYENTLRDLLGVEVYVKDLLPMDTSAHGFDNIGEALHVSSFLMERYLEAAHEALNRAIVNGPPPPVIRKRYDPREEHVIRLATEKVYRKRDDGVVLFSSSNWNAVTLSHFYPQHRGVYRFRLSASGIQSAGKPVVFRLDAVKPSRLLGYFDAPPDEPTVFEFSEYLEAHGTLRIHPYGLAGAQTVNKIGADAYEGPGLALQYVEVEGPINDVWPPTSHRRLFGDLPQKKVEGGRLEVVSKQPLPDAARILRTFARRALRRAVTEADLKPYLDLVGATLAEKRSFEQAVRVGLAAILVSPEFLFLREKPGALDDAALASRLSYFLWSSTPDDELLDQVERGTLRKGDTLRRQVDRLLADPRASAFTENFTGQWLGLRDIDFTEPSHILYPEFDDMLKVSMVRETRLFFEEILKNDLSVSNFIASDFSMLNGRLAKHYGISGVDGWTFRKVMLPPESHRGGVLTMGSVLKVTANGTQTSPVLRGAWVLDRILGTPPPRPPAGVASVEPDIRGTTTIRDQLAKHRQIAACASCHVRIDPPGFALESFDVIGGWREYYRSSGNGKAVTVDGKKMPYLHGKRVDPADEMEDGRKFTNIDEFKQLLLADREAIARALVGKLLTYATGGAPATADRPALDAMLRNAKDKDYGLRTLLHEIVGSAAFQNK